jgi:transposase
MVLPASKNPQRDADIVWLYRDGVTDEELSRLYGVGAGRIMQIVNDHTPEYMRRPDKFREYRLRAQAMAAWRRNGMTYRQIGQRYGISAGRANQIVMLEELREIWKRKPPKRVLARALAPPGLEMKPGAIWHTWYLDPTRRDR